MKLEQVQRYGVVERPVQGPRVQPAGTITGYRIEDLLPGEVRTRADGSCFVVPNVYASDHMHGLHSFSSLSRTNAAQLALICRDPELTYLDLSKAVFLDTETTGLGTGVGTYVFLVGAGYVAGNEFRVEQFFLRGPSEEKSFLAELEEFLARFSAIVTFNGKAFDWPLLENRFVLHRRSPPLLDPPHLDLLHPARRLWKRRLESCRLSALESHILGVERTEEDVPGFMIPSLYFEYQTTGDGRPLARVFYHNLQDVLSLAALAVHIDRVIAEPYGGLVWHGADFLSLARVYERVGAVESALACYEEGLRRDLLREDRLDCLARLATLQKRERRWDAALPLWDRLLDEGGAYAMLARVELAKYYEHVERDYLQAIDHVQNALELSDLFEAPCPEAERRELERRLGRLVNRAMRARSWVRDRG